MLEIIKKYLDTTVETIRADAESKKQRIPNLRVEASETSGQVISSDYFKYLVLGRGPGKAPPPEKMLKVVEDHPEMLAEARKVFKNIVAKGLAYLIGRKIARHGTDIFQGKKPGVDLIGSMEKGMPDLLSAIGRAEAVKFLTVLRSELNSK